MNNVNAPALALDPIGAPRTHTLRKFSIPWASFRRHWVTWIAGGFLVLVVVLALAAPYIAPYDPNQISMTNTLAGPSQEHWLGTDQLGRDHLSRLLYGGSTTLMLATIAMLGTVALGLVFGVVAGYFGGMPDLIISQVLNILMALPSLLLALAILGILGPSTTSLLLALIAAGWVGHARIFRSAILSLREQLYIESAVSIGATPTRVVVRHLLPNLITTVAVLATLDLGVMILTITSLSFLGLGVQPPTADWGTMLQEARQYFGQYPLLVVAPGICISLVVVASNFLGDGIRDIVDVRD